MIKPINKNDDETEGKGQKDRCDVLQRLPQIAAGFNRDRGRNRDIDNQQCQSNRKHPVAKCL